MSLNYKKYSLFISTLAAWFIASLFFMPWHPEFPGENLEQSWQLSLNYAVMHGLSFGSDLIFTFGPLSSAYTRSYYPNIFLWSLMTTGLVVIYLIGSLYRSLKKNNGNALLVLAWGFGISFISTLYLKDAIFLITPYIVFFCVQKDSERNTLGPWSVFGLFVLAMISLVKSTFAITSIAILILTVFLPQSFARRVLPSVIYMLTIGLLWLFSGQPLGSLGSFVTSSIPIIGGYSDAMSSEGSYIPIALYVSGAVLALVESFRNFRFLNSLALAIILFFSFKAGYVRQDIHEVISAGVLILLGIWLASQKVGLLNAALMILAVTLSFYSVNKQANMNMQSFATTWSNQGIQSLRGLRELAKDYQAYQAKFEANINTLSEQHRLPQMQGNADTYSYHQAVLIANGERWNPRPIIQSYSAYTADLARINARHLAAEGRPDMLVFQVEPIDGRFAAMDDGLSWPQIWTNYKLLERHTQGLIFAASPNGRPEFIKSISLDSHLGSVINIPFKDGSLVWVRIKMQKSFLGRIMSFLFKAPQLLIKIQDSMGAWSSYRYLAAVGEAGFLLSPIINTTVDFEHLTKNLSGEQHPITSAHNFSIIQADFPIEAFSPVISVEMSELKIAPK